MIIQRLMFNLKSVLFGRLLLLVRGVSTLPALVVPGLVGGADTAHMVVIDGCWLF
jgi:hypothetical protein